MHIRMSSIFFLIVVSSNWRIENQSPRWCWIPSIVVLYPAVVAIRDGILDTVDNLRASNPSVLYSSRLYQYDLLARYFAIRSLYSLRIQSYPSVFRFFFLLKINVRMLHDQRDSMIFHWNDLDLYFCFDSINSEICSQPSPQIKYIRIYSLLLFRSCFLDFLNFLFHRQYSILMLRTSFQDQRSKHLTRMSLMYVNVLCLKLFLFMCTESHNQFFQSIS